MAKRAASETPSIQSLGWRLSILEAVAESTEPVLLKQLTDLLGIDRSACSGWLTRCGGAALPANRPAARTTSSVRRRGGCRAIRAETFIPPATSTCANSGSDGETAHLAVREGGRRCSSIITRRRTRSSRCRGRPASSCRLPHGARQGADPRLRRRHLRAAPAGPLQAIRAAPSPGSTSCQRCAGARGRLHRGRRRAHGRGPLRRGADPRSGRHGRGVDRHLRAGHPVPEEPLVARRPAGDGHGAGDQRHAGRIFCGRARLRPRAAYNDALDSFARRT